MQMNITRECPDYTLAKDWPLTQEQNELIDFGIRRSQAVLSGQAQPKGQLYLKSRNRKDISCSYISYTFNVEI